jgi:murein DD-endopeptidase MepM/ murein hydrolase activator NlpD
VARRFLLTLALALVVVLVGSASGALSSSKESIDARIARLHEQIAAAQARETTLRGQISSVTKQIRGLERRVGDVSQKLAAVDRDLALHRERLAKLTELYGLQTERFRFLRAEYGLAITRLDQRLVAIYKQDEPTTADVVLQARSLEDLLDQLDYLGAVANQDKQIASEVRSAKVRVHSARQHTRRSQVNVQSETRVIEVRAHQQLTLRASLLLSHKHLSKARRHKLEALASTKEDEREFIHEAEGLARQSAALGSRIRASQSSSADTTPSASGLIWPVIGPVTSPFGMRWGRMHEGIDIGVGYGTPIRAAAAGTVIYCGWMEGYGNLVVIDHGGGIATAYGHQSSIAVGCGQAVSQGEVIGYVGCTGHCFGPHLHFEVRINGAPVDPLGYL